MNFEREHQRLGELAQDDLIDLSSRSDYIFGSALLRGNYEKNRYTNILPYEHARVKANRRYINASYVEVDDQCMIMTQAPLIDTRANTTADFWRMVWENRSPVVVMLTNLVEQGRKKADIYWPDETDPTKKYQQELSPEFVEVRQISFETTSFGEVRKFQLTCEEETRVVRHVWYKQWPDFGVPEEVSGLFEVLRIVDEAMAQRLGIPIVHCSAGVGRAGVFVCLKLLLSKNSFVEQDVFDTVRAVRKCRLGAVQTPEQLEFLFNAAFEGRRQGLRFSKVEYPRHAEPKRFISPLAMSRPPDSFINSSPEPEPPVNLLSIAEAQASGPSDPRMMSLGSGRSFRCSPYPESLSSSLRMSVPVITVGGSDGDSLSGSDN